MRCSSRSAVFFASRQRSSYPECIWNSCGAGSSKQRVSYNVKQHRGDGYLDLCRDDLVLRKTAKGGATLAGQNESMAPQPLETGHTVRWTPRSPRDLFGSA